ncbi:MAG TPA: type II toxin-antitoxin system HicB family antitoxin [Bryobacteraceae bacterium]|nr:type II toxin-antitoxin system HicB family antitoxin [Bryobacteraceae bacterium]
MSRHAIILYWSDEDQSFIAEVPELARCMADGATRQEAPANAEVVIAEWIETARELGRAIPEPRGRLCRLTEQIEPIHVEMERENDGRMLASVPLLPGVMAYGATEEEALRKAKAIALQVLADMIASGESQPAR